VRRIRAVVCGGGDALVPVGRITQTLDTAAIQRQLHSSSGGIARDMLRRGLRVQANARRRAPARTGRLRGSIEVATVPRVVSGVSTFGVVVGTNLRYAPWVINGTGVYGPSHSPIRPRQAKFLVFVDRRARGRSARVNFAKQVAGQRGNNFLKDALPAARGRSGVT
jgi:hypothetical protein